jgi:hypothetical protein
MPKLARLDVPLYSEPLAREVHNNAAWVSGQFSKIDAAHAETAARLAGQHPLAGKYSPTLVRTAVSIGLFGAVAAVVLHYYGTGNVFVGLHKLSPFTIGVVFAALVANALAAALRFEMVAAFTGHAIGFRRAMAAVGAGTLAGAAFFQLAGQLMARGVIARQGGMPFAAVVVVTGYERIVAAIVSGLLAIAGAWFIFGKVYLDQATGGAILIKITCGLIAAMTGGALVGFGRLAARSIAPLMTRHFARRCLSIIGLTLLVQIPMMIAYITVAHALSPQTPVGGIAAASAIVMFAASVPISLAGWGVREMSAVIALGAIGVAAYDALTAAVAIGAGSILAMAVIATVSLPNLAEREVAPERQATSPIDYGRVLGWIIPVTAAVFVLFQIHVPIGSGLLNVNLADPVAILGGAFFVLKAFRQGHLPRWRVNYVNMAVAAATLALGAALLIGVSHFGWTDWALINRFLGWFVLLAFGASGALAIAEGGENAFRIVLLSYIGAVAAVSLFETSLIFVNALGFSLDSMLVQPFNAEGFAQNHNAFAFQLLMALAATLVASQGRYSRTCFLTLILVGLWFAGSRSGWIAAVFVLGASIYLEIATARQIIRALICAAIVAAIGAVLPVLHVHDLLFGYQGGPGAALLLPEFVPDQSSTAERMLSIVGGLKLFLAHPVFGAGLGAFQNEKILASDGFPLVIHSTAVWLLAELGIIGFFAFAAPGLYVWVFGWLRARENQMAAFIALGFVVLAVMSGPADMLYQRTFCSWARRWRASDIHFAPVNEERHYGRRPSKTI